MSSHVHSLHTIQRTVCHIKDVVLNHDHFNYCIALINPLLHDLLTIFDVHRTTSFSNMPFFSSKPRAVVYTAHSAVSAKQTAAIIQRRASEEISTRCLCKSIEALPLHQKCYGIDNWDFVTPGQSREEDAIVNKIMKRVDAHTDHDLGVKEEDREMLIIRAGFKKEDPTNYKRFIAALGY
jgi:hypothetical protein